MATEGIAKIEPINHCGKWTNLIDLTADSFAFILKKTLTATYQCRKCGEIIIERYY